MARKKTLDGYFLRRGRVWYAWAPAPVAVAVKARTKREAHERLFQAVAAKLYPGARGVTSRTADFEIRERLVLDDRAL